MNWIFSKQNSQALKSPFVTWYPVLFGMNKHVHSLMSYSIDFVCMESKEMFL